MFRRLLFTLIAAALPAAALADHVAGHTTFNVRIENVTTTATLKLSNGQTAPAPNSPGLWLVFKGTSPVFTPGKLQAGHGLESQSEDGSPANLATWIQGAKAVKSSGVFDTPVGDAKPGPATPGKAYEFTVDAVPGDRLMITTMMGQSNDWFYAPKPAGIALFEKGRPLSGDVTTQFMLWDAGTERDEEPGLGPNQGPRQSAVNTGPAESKPVSLAKSYPAPPVGQVLRVTVSPAGMAAK